MGTYYSPSVITNGLVFYYDMNNTNKSWFGQPTTNLLGVGMSIYNNVPSDVSAVLEATSETYMGATVYKQTLTPLTATGVSYLTGGNNPGIGVVTSGGGGTANRYTGFSIFYKPTVPMSSSPIFTNYSNIPGWQSGGNFNSMGDGWFRANVIWYDTVTRTDGKYWAINPLTATLNVPIVIYWAAPFKEDRNDSAYVAQYTYSSRSNTQSILDLTNNNTVTTNSLTYNSNGTFSFNGSSDFISTNLVGSSSSFTHEVFLRPTNVSKDQMYIGYSTIPAHYVRIVGSQAFLSVSTTGGQQTMSHPQILANNTNYHIVSCYNGVQLKIYVNSVIANGSVLNQALTGWGINRIGRWLDGDQRAFVGTIFNLKTYNRELSELEVQQNFNALRGIYGI